LLADDQIKIRRSIPVPETSVYRLLDAIPLIPRIKFAKLTQATRWAETHVDMTICLNFNFKLWLENIENKLPNEEDRKRLMAMLAIVTLHELGHAYVRFPLKAKLVENDYLVNGRTPPQLLDALQVRDFGVFIESQVFHVPRRDCPIGMAGHSSIENAFFTKLVQYVLVLTALVSCLSCVNSVVTAICILDMSWMANGMSLRMKSIRYSMLERVPYVCQEMSSHDSLLERIV
jgi:hypothetical protein